MPRFTFDNTYARALPGTYVFWKPTVVPAPRMLFFNTPLAERLGLELELDSAGLSGTAGAADAALFAGNVLPEGAEPLAQAYAGHQFGGFSPQLGDGRALLLGEVIDKSGQRRDIAFKGSGRTPFSRGGDGKAAVGPMLREVLIGEAMQALGIPTTQALAVVATGEAVYRDAATLPGAVLTRVAASHLRVGTFQYFAARGELEQLHQLTEYAIARHAPELVGTPERHVALLRFVAVRQARLIAQWMNVGFIHGVMNTDNMTISGETIDYGPCAFMEAYDPATVFSSIDHGGRYAYANQPLIARWNLARLAETLLPLMANGDDASQADAVNEAAAQVTQVIDEFPALYAAELLKGQRAKLGLLPNGPGSDDATLVADWLALLQQHRVDFTLAWRRLCDAAEGDANPLRALFAEPGAVNPWLARWQVRCAREDTADDAKFDRAARMRAVNPWVIPRNHRVEEALSAASEGDDLTSFERLLSVLRRPFDENPDAARYADPAPAQITAAYQTFCGT
ncbi:MAG: YdiU family protein [Rhodoferax sp.]|nr:YdiU family protein [Rhodoferax sp.]